MIDDRGRVEQELKTSLEQQKLEYEYDTRLQELERNLEASRQELQTQTRVEVSPGLRNLGLLRLCPVHTNCGFRGVGVR